VVVSKKKEEKRSERKRGKHRGLQKNCHELASLRKGLKKKKREMARKRGTVGGKED